MSTERESMQVDAVIVGAGPAGLSAACRLKQLATQHKKELSVGVLEKGAEVGAHILSGAVFEPRALDELFPDWKKRGAPLDTSVTADEIYLLRNEKKAIAMPHWTVPKPMRNDGNYIISLGDLCRWLGQQAEALGVEIFPGFAASEVLYHKDGSIKGVATGEQGRGVDGKVKDSFEPGMELHARVTLFAEGCRGHLGKQLIEKFDLAADRQTQHYAIGIKELWQIDRKKHRRGLVVHGAGWPLSQNGASGGSFLYHLGDDLISLGLITDLSYSNPYISPFDELQRMKHHPVFSRHIEGGERIARNYQRRLECPAENGIAECIADWLRCRHAQFFQNQGLAYRNEIGHVGGGIDFCRLDRRRGIGFIRATFRQFMAASRIASIAQFRCGIA